MKGYITRISSKGQVTIPKEIREYLKIEPGDKVRFEIVKGGVILKVLKRPSESMLGVGLKVKRKLKVSAADLIAGMRREDYEEE